MDRDSFWLSKEQFARLKPHLPSDTRGKPRVDDRRVISGIIHVLKCGCRWIDAPPAYGPRKTLYNRFVRTPCNSPCPLSLGIIWHRPAGQEATRLPIRLGPRPPTHGPAAGRTTKKASD